MIVTSIYRGHAMLCTEEQDSWIYSKELASFLSGISRVCFAHYTTAKPGTNHYLGTLTTEPLKRRILEEDPISAAGKRPPSRYVPRETSQKGFIKKQRTRVQEHEYGTCMYAGARTL